MGRVALTMIVLATAAALPPAACAQDFPARLVRIVVPFPPGGGADRLARMVSEKLRLRWGQPVIVENRAGAAGNIGSEYVANAPADGHTVLYGAAQQFVISKMIYRKLNYDPDAFVPVSVLTSAPIMLIAHQKLGAETLQQFLALARRDPGRINYSSTGTASSQHLTAELLQSQAGVRITHVPFNGTGPAMTAVLAGQVETMFTEVNNAHTYFRAGRLRPLAVGSEKRMTLLPDVPTFSELLPGLLSSAWGAVGAPAGTPGAAVNTMSAALAEAIREADIARYLNESFIEPVGSTPAEMAGLIRQEKARWSGVIRSLNLSMD